MLEALIKVAIKKINELDGEYQYTVTRGTSTTPPHILVKGKPYLEYVVDDIDCILSITATHNTLMLYDEGSITIISPSNYTYHTTDI